MTTPDARTEARNDVAPGRAGVREWRNWSLPVKFAAVVLVPVLFAVGLGVSQIRWQVEQADEYNRVAEVLDTAQRVEPLVEALQAERNAAVQRTLGEDVGLAERISNVDKTASEVDAQLGEPGEFGQLVQDRQREMHLALDKLRTARPAVQAGLAPAPQVIEGYTTAINTVLSMDRALTSTVSEPSLSSTASALQDMLGLMEEVRFQQAWVLTGLSEGNLDQQAINELLGSRARLESKITDARATVARHWEKRLGATLLSPPIQQRNGLLTAIVAATMDDKSSGGYPVGTEQWNSVSDQVVALIDDGHNDLADEVRGGAAKIEEDASAAAGWDSVLLLSALIAAAAVIITISRQLLGSLRALRRGALDAADNELPDAVEGIRAGGEVNEIRPLPVSTTEEVGQVARAFDEVQRQALRLAAKQAVLRHGYSESFVGVSRRSQSLLERQLRLFEQLEQDEEDPDQLSRLFQLDHLATRMRRNNENLMVLSGSDLARRFVRPTDLSDVLRAAVSEIEQYPRVVLQPPPQAKILGHTASDMVRLLAEVMDNAANFSSPDTSVTVSTYQAGDGSITVDVLDEGIGMGEAELADANAKLARVEENDLATSRRMGLFVISRLALRHGIAVRLYGGPDVEGVRSTVVVPAEHVVSTAGPPASAQPTPAQGGQRNGFAHHDMPTSGAIGAAQSAQSGASASGAATAEETAFQRNNSGVDSAETGFSTAQPDNTFNSGFFTGSGEDVAGNALPKREPSAGMFAPSQRDEETHDPGDAPTASLFTPLEIPEQQDGQDFRSDWTSSDLAWPPAIEDSATQAPSTSGDAPSPIFEEVSTQWFQPAPEPEAAPDEHAWPTGEPTGGSTADSGTAGFPGEQATGSGLPRRDPGGSAGSEPRIDESDPLGIDHLADGRNGTGGEDLGRSGAAGNGTAAAEPDSAGRSPHELSRRLADLQGGLRFGRKGPVQSQETEQEAAPETAADRQLQPRRNGGSSWITESAESHGADSNGAEAGADGWNFATDDGWKQAAAATSSSPESFTSSGLPRRTPKAQLAPGSAGTFFGEQEEQDKPFERDANALRGRLSSFQTGVQRGRHRAPDES